MLAVKESISYLSARYCTQEADQIFVKVTFYSASILRTGNYKFVYATIVSCIHHV